jgi:hypothetical protein
VEISWNTETQVLVAVFVVNEFTWMPVFFSKACRYLVVWLRSFGVTGSPMVSTSSPVEPLLPLPDEDPHAASSGPATAAAAPADSSFRRLIIGRPAETPAEDTDGSGPGLAFPRARCASSLMPCLPSWRNRPALPVASRAPATGR